MTQIAEQEQTPAWLAQNGLTVDHFRVTEQYIKRYGGSGADFIRGSLFNLVDYGPEFVQWVAIEITGNLEDGEFLMQVSEYIRRRMTGAEPKIN
ncbi:hypothetical protein COT75_05270 [Candidatus Beckwithbacteria bacterium CG10_big_fil_rev_8_21_14_0_10_34_10]|uniref:Uncharacterized protein n=1 Tax=Candidatus Beckwithbacteria bacterium CG10_big_fil_rev_8_21_14_0_10_34_10 TaxID=1974495 RepID=A0A2H0W7T9_9BACT|nr:MAG: hypothetical protein COT75_05270 [Candidatus Beckwithbacteria bacterium CG10_big_fil_rev_8_21_14_0_10_34_10]